MRARGWICWALWVAVGAGHAAEKSGVGLNKISLPTGPGSIEGLGDAFEPQLNTGTSSYSVKIAAPPGVAGLQPDIVLRYNSGGGNGHFGIAWSAGGLCVQRQTEKGLPTYGPGDKFTLGGEELVPLSDGSYRCENESSFQRIVRDGTGWIVYDKKGTRYFLGSKPLATNPSRIVRPGGATFDDTFKWCVDDVIDVHGNEMKSIYATFTDSPGEVYLSEVRYSIFGGEYHAIAFDYEQRPDAFSSYLSGFQVRTGRRCSQIRVTSRGGLVRRYVLGYSLPSDDPVEVIAPNDGGLEFSLLRQVTQYGNIEGGDDYLPPLRMGYTRFDAAGVTSGAFLNPAGVSLGNPNMALADINCDGLPDLFHTDPSTGTHWVYHNEGLGRWSAGRPFVAQPTGFTLDNEGSELADYDGDGRIDLVQKAGASDGLFIFYANLTQPAGNDDTRPAWGDEQSFDAPYPPFDLNDPSVRTLDLDNDKRIDFMRTTAAGFIYYYNHGDSWEEDGLYLFGEPQMGDIEYADALVFDDGGAPNVHVKLADMNGDRLLDLVRVHLFDTRLEITYWPNRGRGWWGSRTEMSGTVDIGVIPVEDAHVRDINGDGLADVVAVGYDQVSYWINQGDDGFSRRFEVTGTPEYIKGQTVLTQADINGNGSTDFLWENWSPSDGAYRVQYVDFIGAVRPNLLKAIDNGIGALTEIEYRTSTDYYVAALKGSNPWNTRLPVPCQIVSKISRRFGLDLDALPGEDRYVTEFFYHDGYYDGFEKEFRGFAFARKVERGDDRRSDGGPAATVHSPSLVTRMAFHTGVRDFIDNDGDNRTDEFDTISGYEEEALKGKVLWTETCLLGPEFDEVDDDFDGFVDEADEGTFAGQPSPEAAVFSRDANVWSLKAIHDEAGGFSQPGASLPFRTLNGQKVTFPFVSENTKAVIDAVGTLHAGNSYASGAGPVTLRSTTQVDFFGNPTREENYGAVSGTPLPTDDERLTITSYAFNLDKWIVGLPTEIRVEDESGNFVSKTRNYYDGAGLGSVGVRGLLTSEEKFLGSGVGAIEAESSVPGDPRAGASASVTTRYQYDAYGNPIQVQDPEYGGAGGGHYREFAFDPVFHTYVEQETIHVGGGSPALVASAAYDYGGGVVVSSEDFNGNVSSYGYDRFYRITSIVKPGDSSGAPTQVFEYRPGDPRRGLVYTYDAAGDLSLSNDGAGSTTSRVTVRARETAGGGTFDIVQVTDGLGHKLGTVEEGESGNFVFKDVKRYTSRGHERDSYLPFFNASVDFVTPASDVPRVTMYYDALGRAVRAVNPPETSGGRRAETKTLNLPLKTVLFDEEDCYAASPHNDTPHVQYKDGLDRLIGVDEINKEGGPAATYPTRYAYDLNDKLVRIVDSQNNRKWMRYDGLGRMIFMHDPDRGVLYYTYDDASNLIETEDAKGQHILMAYDGANRILTEDYLDAAGLVPDVAYHYDAPVTGLDMGDGTTDTASNVKGQLAYVQDLTGEEHFSYDARSRMAYQVKRVPDPTTGALVSYATRYAYDSLDRVTSLTYPDGDSLSHQYNARSLLERITGGPSGYIISGVDYIASGQMSGITYGNGVTTAYAYDPRLRLNSLNTENGTPNTLIAYGYTFDGAGNITRIDDLRSLSGDPDAEKRRNTQVFAYDSLYRLTQVQYPAILGGMPGSIDYAYDRIGNMLSKTSNIPHDEKGLSVTDLGAMSYGGTAGASGRVGRSGGQPGPHALTGVANGGRAYPYDANGNMTDIDGLACTWDFKDRLVAVENDEMTAEYIYDYTDRRIRKKVTPKAGQPGAGKTQHVTYVNRYFELREGDAPVKYVWNGETRVARVTGRLDGGTARTQTFRLDPGWNLVGLCADTPASEFAGPNIPHVDEVARYDVAANRVLPLGAGTLPAGTVLWLHATQATVAKVFGTAANPANPALAGGVGRYVANFTRDKVDAADAFPETTDLWVHQLLLGSWGIRYAGELASASIEMGPFFPGAACFAKNPVNATVTLPNAACEIRYYHQDHLGSSNAMTDRDANLVEEIANYPFGHPRNSYRTKPLTEVYTFTQKERDGESGLHYFEARYLVVGAGRFASSDPFLVEGTALAAAAPQMLNSYSYVRGNPLAYKDQSGEVSILFGAGVGALKGLFVQVAADYVRGRVSNAEDYAGGIVGGAVEGAVFASGGFAVSGAAGAVVGAAAKGIVARMNNRSYTATEALTDIAIDISVGYGLGKLAKSAGKEAKQISREYSRSARKAVNPRTGLPPNRRAMANAKRASETAQKSVETGVDVTGDVTKDVIKDMTSSKGGDSKGEAPRGVIYDEAAGVCRAGVGSVSSQSPNEGQTMQMMPMH